MFLGWVQVGGAIFTTWICGFLPFACVLMMQYCVISGALAEEGFDAEFMYHRMRQQHSNLRVIPRFPLQANCKA